MVVETVWSNGTEPHDVWETTAMTVNANKLNMVYLFEIFFFLK